MCSRWGGQQGEGPAGGRSGRGVTRVTMREGQEEVETTTPFPDLPPPLCRPPCGQGMQLVLYVLVHGRRAGLISGSRHAQVMQALHQFTGLEEPAWACTANTV